MPWADCRNCKRFVPLNRCPESLRQFLMHFARANGVEVLGWCNYHRKPITYYEGYCHAYLPRRRIEGCSTLDEWVGG